MRLPVPTVLLLTNLVAAASVTVPLSFERATGATRWTARGEGYFLSVGPADVEVLLGQERLRIRFAGGNADARPEGLEPLPGKVNYLIGADPKRWLRNLPTYARVRAKNVYPGTDIAWYGNQGRLEYDLALASGADPSSIAMQFEGARKLSLDASGDLRIELARGSLTLKPPEVYQQSQRIEAAYDLRASSEVRFRLAPYDRSRPLVIDPVLVYASYFGSGTLFIRKMAVDGAGNVYLGGEASLPDSYLPVANAFQPGNLGASDIFISKLDPTGKTLLFSTYIGGASVDTLAGMAVDANGRIAVTGSTQSLDFPIVNGWPPAQAKYTAYGLMLDAGGDRLVYSTTLAMAPSNGRDVAMDAEGNAYFAGRPDGPIASTPGALNEGHATYLIKLSSTGNTVYGALLANVFGTLAVDASGAAYLAGTYPSHVVAKLRSDATALAWTTSITGAWSLTAIALSQGRVYVGGVTTESTLPVTAGAVQPAYKGNRDAFVASLSADNGSFGFVTYLGGSNSDSLTSLAVASDGQLIVGGSTYSPDFPLSSPLQPAFPGPARVLFRSRDSGASFAAQDQGLISPQGGPPGNQGKLLPDPSSASTLIFSGTGGIYRSSDDGVNWSRVSSVYGPVARSLSNPSVLYQASTRNLSKSSDGGQTWTDYGLPAFQSTYSPCAVGVSPTNSDIVLFRDCLSGNWYRSVNGGAGVGQLQHPFPSNYISLTDSIISSRDGSMYFQSFKSTDDGQTWAALANAPMNNCGFAVSPTNPAVLYASDCYDVYRSANAGTDWMKVAAGANVAHLAVDPSNAQRLYGLSWGRGQALVSADGGATWTPTGGFVEVQSSGAQDLVINPLNAAELYLLNLSVQRLPESGFVAKLSDDGKRLVWSTYYGSYTGTVIVAVAAAPTGGAWIAGLDEADLWTSGSAGVPLTSDAQNRNTAAGSMFLARLADQTPECAYSINPDLQYDHGMRAALPLTVTAPSGCPWTASPSDSWIHLTRTAGTGSGTIPLWIDPNSTANTRTGTVDVNGHIYTVVQPGANCIYAISAPTVESAGGPTTVSVTAPGGCPWDVQLVGGDPAWIASPATGSGNGSVTIVFPANYGIDARPVEVIIGGSSRVVAQKAACVFTFSDPNPFLGAAEHAQASVDITANMAGCRWSAASDQPWLVASNAYSTGSGSLRYSVSANDTRADRVAHIKVGYQQITVTQLSAPAIAAVVNAASQAAPISPGQMVLVRGTDLGPKALARFEVSDGDLVPTTLAGTRVLFNGVAGPMIYAQNDRCAAMVPYQIPTAAPVNVEVEYEEARSAPLQVAIAPTAPGLFTADSSGSGQATALNAADMTVNSSAAPAAAGSSVILFGTGEGLTAPAGVDGMLTNGTPPVPVGGCSVEIGGLPAQVESCGALPFSPAGLFQVKAGIAPGVTPGDQVAVKVTIGAASSQPGVTLAIR